MLKTAENIFPPCLTKFPEFFLRTTEKLFETLVENSMKQRVKLRKVTLVSNEQLVDGHWPLSSVHPLARGSIDTWTLPLGVPPLGVLHW